MSYISGWRGTDVIMREHIIKTNQNNMEDQQFPRRSRLDLCEPAELAIYNAMQEVEKMGADVKLTDAIVKLQEAKELIADYIDKK